jgi:predicted Zn-dependent protease
MWGMKNQFLKLSRSLSLEWASLRVVEETSVSRTSRNGVFESREEEETTGFMVEVAEGGGFGYAASPGNTPEDLEWALLQARSLAAAARARNIFKFDPKLHRGQGQHVEVGVGFQDKELEESLLWERLNEMSARLKNGADVLDAEAIISTTRSVQSWHDTSGSSFERSQRWFSVQAGATASRGGVTQTRTLGGFRAHSHQGGDGLLFRITDQAIDQVGEELQQLLVAEPCPDGKFDLILMPDQMMLQIHESIGHPLELDRILGDERNYAGSSFVKISDFGSLQYGSPVLNVTFDPTIAEEFATYRFDDVGHEAKKEFLIKDGKLLRGLGSLESIERSGVPGVANARASGWNRPPLDRMANLNIEPGDRSLAELISSVKDGVLMSSNRSWSIDDYRNKFQFGCEYGRRIRDGKLAEVVRNPGYRGVSTDFWRSLSDVGSSETFEVYGTPNCGKAEPNQMIRVGHASPACLFRGVEVFGGQG